MPGAPDSKTRPAIDPDGDPGGVPDGAGPPETRHLDLRGLLCPLPVIRIGDAARAGQPGQVLIVDCTDPGAREDVSIWCEMHGHALVGIETWDERLRLTIRLGQDQGG